MLFAPCRFLHLLVNSGRSGLLRRGRYLTPHTNGQCLHDDTALSGLNGVEMHTRFGPSPLCEKQQCKHECDATVAVGIECLWRGVLVVMLKHGFDSAIYTNFENLRKRRLKRSIVKPTPPVYLTLHKYQQRYQPSRQRLSDSD